MLDTARNSMSKLHDWTKILKRSEIFRNWHLWWQKTLFSVSENTNMWSGYFFFWIQSPAFSLYKLYVQITSIPEELHFLPQDFMSCSSYQNFCYSHAFECLKTSMLYGWMERIQGDPKQANPSLYIYTSEAH